MDCFGTLLPDIYEKPGFVPVARLRWNDNCALDGWNYSKYKPFNSGRPDLVFMVQIRLRYSELTMRLPDAGIERAQARGPMSRTTITSMCMLGR